MLNTVQDSLFTSMTDSTTVVLQALSTLHSEISDTDEFAGYTGDLHDVKRLLNDLWGLVEAHGEPLPSAAMLVDAWYDQFFAEMEGQL